MSTFKAFRVHNEDGKINSRFEQMSIDQIGTGNVVIKAAYSNINYKDALAATGAGRIMRRFPLVAGIDTAGFVDITQSALIVPSSLLRNSAVTNSGRAKV